MSVKTIGKFLLLNSLGSMSYSLGIHAFTAPQKIAPGGASGIGVLVNYLTEFPIGLFTFIFNIPLLMIAYKYVTKKFFWNALVSITLFSFITDYIVVQFPIYKGDPLLATLFGGVFMGIGLAMVHLTESTTGGLTILGVILQKKYPQFEVGKVMFVLNFSVVIVSGFVFKNIESVLYATVAIYVSSQCMDGILRGLNCNKFVVIISDQNEKMREAILASTQKGITLLEGVGGYSKNDKQVTLCAVSQSECVTIQKIVKEVDQKAFMIITEASQVVGNGFKSLI